MLCSELAAAHEELLPALYALKEHAGAVFGRVESHMQQTTAVGAFMYVHVGQTLALEVLTSADGGSGLSTAAAAAIAVRAA